MEAKRTKLKRKTVKQKYPFFHDMAEAVDDPEWQETFKNMAVGKFPIAGLYMVDNCLVYKTTGRKKPEFEFQIPNDPKTGAESLMKLLYQRLGINRHDIGSNLLEYISQFTKVENYEWNRLKSTQQLLFVPNYIKRYKEANGLTNEQARQLQLVVEQAIIDKKLRKNDVVFENNRLLEVKPLKCENGYYYIERPERTTITNRTGTTRKPALSSRSHNSPIHKLLEIFQYYYGLLTDTPDNAKEK